MFRSLRYARWPRESSLSVFDLVPDFGVFLPARHVLPEINLLHICVGVVEMQAFHLVRREQLRGRRIRGCVVRHVGDELLRLRLPLVLRETPGGAFLGTQGGVTDS